MSEHRIFKRICVFCGSSNNVDPAYIEMARSVGKWLAESGIGLVYGGGRVGLMGAVADGALEAGGEVQGVIPEKILNLEVGHEGLGNNLHVVRGMHARKAMMARLSDAFIALPGGWGTLEEIFEVTTWAQLNYHLKPVGMLNFKGFYDGLVQFIHHASDEGFIRPMHRDLMVVSDEIGALVQGLATVTIPETEKWISRP
ncbi:MAG: TIGR00730 family Rossman fold protein [Bradymonadia bacterium]